MHAMLTEDRVELYVNALFSAQHGANVVRLSIRFTPKSKWRHVTLTLNEAAGLVMALNGERANFDEPRNAVRDIHTTDATLHPRQEQLLANAGVTELPPPPAVIHVPFGWDSVEGGIVEEAFEKVDDAYDEPALWLTEEAALAGGMAYQERCSDRWPRPVFQVRPRRKKIDLIDGWACDIINTQRDNACAHTIMAFEWGA